MGAEFQVESLEEMCDLMCNNKVPTPKLELLSIEETIRQLKKCKSFHNGSYGEALNIAIKALEQEQKTGHWKVVSDGYGDNAYICECSECKDTVWVYKDADRKWNYCPNCGAKMRVNK